MKATTITLTILAVLAFLTGGMYSYMNSEELKKMKDLTTKREKMVTNKTDLNVGLEEDEENDEAERDGLLADIVETDDQFAQTDETLKRQQSDNSSLQANIASLVATNSTKTQEVRDFEVIRRTVTEIQDRQLRVSQLDESIGTSTDELNQQKATADELRETSRKEFQQVNNLRTGGIEAGFSTRVSSTSLQDGFVVISSGYNDNIAAGAEFSLTRGGQQIALGKVSSVSANQAVVRLDPKSSNARVSAGDTAVYVPR